MRRFHYLAGLTFALAISSSAGAHDEKFCSPEEVKQKLLRLEGSLRGLEALVESVVLSSRSLARPDHVEIAGLEQQVSEMEALLRTLSQPAEKAPAARRESDRHRIAQLESLLAESRESAAQRQAAESVRIAELEKRLQELQASAGRTPSTTGVAIARLEEKTRRLEELLRPRRTSPGPAVHQAPPPPIGLSTSTRRRVVAPPPSPPPAGPSTSTRRRVVLPPPKPDSMPRQRVVPPQSATSAIQPSAKPPAANQAFCATLRLRSKPEIPNPIDADGPNFFGIFTYDVLDGPAAGQTIQIAHGVRWNGKNTCVTTRKIGTKLVLEVVPLWWYPQLNKVERLGPGRTDGVIFTPRLPH